MLRLVPRVGLGRCCCCQSGTDRLISRPAKELIGELIAVLGIKFVAQEYLRYSVDLVDALDRTFAHIAYEMQILIVCPGDTGIHAVDADACAAIDEGQRDSVVTGIDQLPRPPRIFA